MNVKRYSPAFLLFALAAIAGAALFAQSFQGGVRGAVLDPAGAAIPNASVTLSNEGTAETRNAATNVQGQYSFAAVNPATYSVTIEASGFKKLTRTGVVVAAQETATVDISMQLGEASQSVEVNTEAALIETSTAS